MVVEPVVEVKVEPPEVSTVTRADVVTAVDPVVAPPAPAYIPVSKLQNLSAR